MDDSGFEDLDAFWEAAEEGRRRRETARGGEGRGTATTTTSASTKTTTKAGAGAVDRMERRREKEEREERRRAEAREVSERRRRKDGEERETRRREAAERGPDFAAYAGVPAPGEGRTGGDYEDEDENSDPRNGVAAGAGKDNIRGAPPGKWADKMSSIVRRGGGGGGGSSNGWLFSPSDLSRVSAMPPTPAQQYTL